MQHPKPKPPPPRPPKPPPPPPPPLRGLGIPLVGRGAGNLPAPPPLVAAGFSCRPARCPKSAQKPAAWLPICFPNRTLAPDIQPKYVKMLVSAAA
jgi:hypothetical protein